jgi:hypothetical protein
MPYQACCACQARCTCLARSARAARCSRVALHGVHAEHALHAAHAQQEVIVSERRFKYEEEVRANPLNYDAWFDYLRLEEDAGDIERAREVQRPAGGLRSKMFVCGAVMAAGCMQDVCGAVTAAGCGCEAGPLLWRRLAAAWLAAALVAAMAGWRYGAGSDR